jgi:hypothetical protein
MNLMIHLPNNNRAIDENAMGKNSDAATTPL